MSKANQQPEWLPSRLGDLCSPRRELVEPSAVGANRYVGLEHIDPGCARIRRWGTDAGLRSIKARFRGGDVLYGKLRPYLGKAVLAGWEGVCSTDILVLKPDAKKAEPAFLSFLLHSPGFLAHAIASTKGVNHPRTDWNSIAAFECPVPSREEQRNIAAVLTGLQAKVEIRDRVVSTLKELKAAIMAKLFREGLGGEPLKQTEIEEIPESWDVVKIGEHCEMSSGGTPSRERPEYWGGDIPWVKTAEIDYRPITKTGETITALGLAKSSARLLPKGTVLMAMYGQGVTRGKVAMLEIEAATNQACAALKPRHTLDSSFLYGCLSFAYDRIRNLGHGANQPNLSAEIIRRIPIPLPSGLEEQRRIGAIIKILDARIASAERTKELSSELFDSALTELTSGTVRLTCPSPREGD